MTDIIFRDATRADVPEIVRLLADDALGGARERYEDPLPAAYYDAFAALTAQAGNCIVLAETAGRVVGCAQLLFLPGLSLVGMKRAQIEGVRVDSSTRGQGLGEKLVQYCIALARQEGCGVLQLTTDKSRADAHRFYEKLGFTGSHLGMKLKL
ncbi:MAG: GNAT family N-acetyltransferase [Alphaproteobacteria bacterium]|nr:GNAT family N-acetyltransferase [Alphaproteobacteria bacterium]MBU0798216.1 GNAT family N-acetyltransferase [Alphaproteobacteria bacterium]MBU0888638.1 GNAT family N-acetyltransferase [Alphaproteobacteria bacterium]MBU1813628.1 GNAT family N-acetyltransferase [Alphaproteobacteria bacterium]